MKDRGKKDLIKFVTDWIENIDGETATLVLEATASNTFSSNDMHSMVRVREERHLLLANMEVK